MVSRPVDGKDLFVAGGCVRSELGVRGSGSCEFKGAGFGCSCDGSTARIPDPSIPLVSWNELDIEDITLKYQFKTTNSSHESLYERICC
uniref:Uncharacterized protein n=1 Tax=Oryza nivara TaxID=4536 RepID=A0A0E0J378_ORYNI